MAIGLFELVYVFLFFIVFVLPVILCYKQAQKKNFNIILSVLFGILFGYITFIVMLFMTPKNKNV